MLRTLCAAVVFIALLTSCGSPASKNELTVAFNSWIGYSAFYIAKEEGLFREQGVNVNLVKIESLQDRNTAMAGGNIDAVGATVDSAVISAAAGVPGKIVFAFDASSGADGLVVASGINSITDLRGKTVAAEEAFTDHFMLLYLLSQSAVKPAEIKHVSLTAQDGAAAFQAGRVDAAATYQPYLSQAASRPESKILTTTKDLPPIIVDVLYVPNRVLAEKSDAIKRLVAALSKANDLWIRSPGKYEGSLAKAWGWKVDEIHATIPDLRVLGSTAQQEFFGQPNGQKGRVQMLAAEAARLWKEAGVIKRDVDSSDISTPQFVGR